MPDERPDPSALPDGCTRYVLSAYERFPTLGIDDGMARGEHPGDQPAGFFPNERTVVLPDAVYAVWESASEQLRTIEDMILEIEAQQIRFGEPPPTPPIPPIQPEPHGD